jgi:hypothetical protein
VPIDWELLVFTNLHTGLNQDKIDFVTDTSWKAASLLFFLETLKLIAVAFEIHFLRDC